MHACFVTSGSLNSVWQDKLSKISGKDLIVFGFNGLGLVSYKKELSGETEYFQDVAKLSKQLSSVIICGCDTDTYGIFRHSAVIADRGKILGVSDMAHTVDESEFVSGGGFRVYDTSAGRIGVIVGDDLFFLKSFETLSLCEAETIIVLMKNMNGFMPQIMLRAGAFSYGVPSALITNNYFFLSNIKGEIVSASSMDIVNTEIKQEKDYHLISFKRRGLFKGE